MADIFKILFGGAAPSPSPVPVAGDDAGFADFAGAPEPAPISILPSPVSPGNSPSSLPTARPILPYTKWYRVWERTTVADFYNEMIIFPFIVLVILVHVWGTRANRKKAKSWITKHAPVLKQEFALVGFRSKRQQAIDELLPEELLKQNTANEFVTYASGRQNIAFLDIKLTLLKRYNPVIILGETVMGFFFDSLPATVERMEATEYAFDGQESQLVPAAQGDSRKSGSNSTYDGFVWAVVNKEMMTQLRNDRYDISLTSTKDHSKLPPWATIMSESSEITEVMLTPELIKAINDVGDRLDALVITDQPTDRPTKLNETVPKKRVTLSIRLPSSEADFESALPIFQYFLRLPDFLTANARFRPEVTKKIRATREDEIRKIKKVDDDEKAEDRKLASDKEKKEKREALLKGMSAEKQKKFLDAEREKEQRKSQKKRTQRA